MSAEMVDVFVIFGEPAAEGPITELGKFFTRKDAEDFMAALPKTTIGQPWKTTLGLRQEPKESQHPAHLAKGPDGQDAFTRRVAPPAPSAVQEHLEAGGTVTAPPEDDAALHEN